MLSLAPTPIGNIADISFRTLEVLKDAQILLCEDTRVTKKLLHILETRYNFEKPNCEYISLHSHNEDAFVKELKKEFFDKNIVYVSDAGMPGISDPGQKLVKWCLENGVEYDILPGANAILSAYVASGFVETKMLFLGFLPHKGKDREDSLNEALYNGYTTILYESPHRLEKLLKEIDIVDKDREIFVAKEITKKHQTFLKGNALEVLAQLKDKIKGEFVVVLKSSPKRGTTFSEKEILDFNLPPKVASKLISKITGENPKACYNRLLNVN